MERSFVTENAKSRERLRQLVDDISDEELNLIIYKEGWTIAVALAHIAFWDQRRVVLMQKWQQNDNIELGALGMDTYDIYNDTALPFLLEIPPRKAANLAVLTAEILDRELEEAPPALIEAIEDSGYPLGLDRSVHRKMHLDEIEALLKSKRSLQ